MAGDGVAPVDVGKIHDRAAALGEERRGGLADEERRLEVGAEEIVPLRLGGGVDRGRVEARGVVDQHIERSETRDDVGDEIVRSAGVEQVAAERRRRARSVAVEGPGELLGVAARRPVVDRDVEAAPMQCPRHGGSDAPCGPGHERHADSAPGGHAQRDGARDGTAPCRTGGGRETRSRAVPIGSIRIGIVGVWGQIRMKPERPCVRSTMIAGASGEG